MDQNPANAYTMSVGDPQSSTPAATPKPKSSFRLIFLVLLLAILASAGATAYILFGNKPPQLIPTSTTPLPQTQAENPFQGQQADNPFVDETAMSANDTNNPFAQANPDNTFAQFDTGSSPSATAVPNPFK